MSGPATFIALPLFLVGALVAGILLIFGPAQEAGACAPGRLIDVAAVPAGPIEDYSGEQLVNAALIMNAASELRLGRNAQVIAVMTAMTESDLTVRTTGSETNPSGRGLFLQDDSGQWGSLTDRLDATTSATNFFTALAQVPTWSALPPTLAAQDVQRSDDPYKYEPYYPAAVTVVGTLAGEGQQVCESGPLAMPLDAGFQLTSGFGYRGFVVEGAGLWHPAVDLQNWPNPCGQPVYAITSGTVTYKAGYQLSIKSPEGYTVSYIHMRLADIVVDLGDTVAPAQLLGAVASEGPSTGCHLDLRISVVGNTNPAVAALRQSQTLGGPPGFVDPEEFYAAFGIELCPAESCRRP